MLIALVAIATGGVGLPHLDQLTRHRPAPVVEDSTGHDGALPEGRTVVAELFNANELGAWKSKLRPGFINFPATLEEALQLPDVKRSWTSRRMMAKVILRTIAARVTGKHWTSAGQALQGRMLQAALKSGIEIRVDAPVTELIVEDGAVTGVATVKDGKPWRVGARLGVLVNAGKPLGGIGRA